MHQVLAAAVGILFVLTGVVRAQDPLAVNPKIVSVAYESDRVRALRLKFDPQERLEMHAHGAIIVVALTPCSQRIFMVDGTQSDWQTKDGDVSWRDPGKEAVQNLGDSCELIEVEFKNAHVPAILDSSSGSAAAKTEPGTDISVEQEPHHRLLLANQYVRALQVSIPAGESLLYHTHSYDNLSVRISGGTIKNQMKGSDLPPQIEVKPGAVVFAEASKKPYTHRVFNLGTSAYRVVDLELL